MNKEITWIINDYIRVVKEHYFFNTEEEKNKELKRLRVIYKYLINN